MSRIYIDHTVYPDRDEADPLKSEFLDDADRADYVDRVCAAWDFDLRPEPATIALFAEWREIFDQFPLPHSPSYHAFRTIYGWDPVPREGGSFITPLYIRMDELEGRTDPCEGMI